MQMLVSRVDTSRYAGIDRIGASWATGPVVAAGTLIDELSVGIVGRIVVGVDSVENNVNSVNSAGSVGGGRIP
jgi:hypothetical protein